MKSTLKIDVGSNNVPIIVASVSTDESDLRDKIMNRFFGSLMGAYEEPDNRQARSYLCYVDEYGMMLTPTYAIYPIPPGEEGRFMNRLERSQAKRMIPLLFQMLSIEDMKELLDNDKPGKLVSILNSAMKSDMIVSEFQPKTK